MPVGWLIRGTRFRTHGGVRGQSAQLPAVHLQQTDTPQGREGLDRRRGGVVGQLGNRILTSPSLWWCYDSK